MFTAEVEFFIYWAFGLLLCALNIHNCVQFSLGLFLFWLVISKTGLNYGKIICWYCALWLVFSLFYSVFHYKEVFIAV